MSYIYVFDFGDCVKVGVSVQPRKRLQEIQRGNNVKAVRTWAADGEDCAKEIELKTHILLHEYLIQGKEYFRCSFAVARNTVIDTATEILGHTVQSHKVGGVVGQAQKEATARYNKNAYDRIDVVVPKGKRERIKAFAAARGISMNKFISDAIERAMEDPQAGE